MPRQPAASRRRASPGSEPDPGESTYCLIDGLDALKRAAPPGQPAAWAPGWREEAMRVEPTAFNDKRWCLSEVDIFCDLSPTELDAIAAAAPMRTFAAGELLFTPHNAIEQLFILKRGRVRIFRLSPDGRALTTSILAAGTIFGEMVLLGQRMYDNYAEAVDEVVVCLMSRSDVQRFLLSDPRIAARITGILGNRLVEMERRLSDAVFKSVPQRLATTLLTLAAPERRMVIGSRAPVVALTHEQLATLVGASRETSTKVLDDFARRGLVRLGRGKVTVLDVARLQAEAGD